MCEVVKEQFNHLFLILKVRKTVRIAERASVFLAKNRDFTGKDFILDPLFIMDVSMTYLVFLIS